MGGFGQMQPYFLFLIAVHMIYYIIYTYICTQTISFQYFSRPGTTSSPTSLRQLFRPISRITSASCPLRWSRLGDSRAVKYRREFRYCLREVMCFGERISVLAQNIWTEILSIYHICIYCALWYTIYIYILLYDILYLHIICIYIYAYPRPQKPVLFGFYE